MWRGRTAATGCATWVKREPQGNRPHERRPHAESVTAKDLVDARLLCRCREAFLRADDPISTGGIGLNLGASGRCPTRCSRNRCQRGASPVSVRRHTSTTGCQVECRRDARWLLFPAWPSSEIFCEERGSQLEYRGGRQRTAGGPSCAP
jgi:hypothetical protein